MVDIKEQLPEWPEVIWEHKWRKVVQNKESEMALEG